MRWRLSCPALKGLIEGARFLKADQIRDLSQRERRAAQVVLRRALTRAIDQRREAYLAERHRNLVAQARANRAAERAMDNATVARAWAQYYQRQVENAPEQVCALIYEGGRADRRCMAKSHFDKYYRP